MESIRKKQDELMNNAELLIVCQEAWLFLIKRYFVDREAALLADRIAAVLAKQHEVKVNPCQSG